MTDHEPQPPLENQATPLEEFEKHQKECQAIWPDLESAEKGLQDIRSKGGPAASQEEEKRVNQIRDPYAQHAAQQITTLQELLSRDQMSHLQAQVPDELSFMFDQQEETLKSKQEKFRKTSFPQKQKLNLMLEKTSETVELPARLLKEFEEITALSNIPTTSENDFGLGQRLVSLAKLISSTGGKEYLRALIKESQDLEARREEQALNLLKQDDPEILEAFQSRLKAAQNALKKFQNELSKQKPTLQKSPPPPPPPPPPEPAIFPPNRENLQARLNELNTKDNQNLIQQTIELAHADPNTLADMLAIRSAKIRKYFSDLSEGFSPNYQDLNLALKTHSITHQALQKVLENPDLDLSDRLKKELTSFLTASKKLEITSQNLAENLQRGPAQDSDLRFFAECSANQLQAYADLEKARHPLPLTKEDENFQEKVTAEIEHSHANPVVIAQKLQKAANKIDRLLYSKNKKTLDKALKKHAILFSTFLNLSDVRSRQNLPDIDQFISQHYDLQASARALATQNITKKDRHRLLDPRRFHYFNNQEETLANSIRDYEQKAENRKITDAKRIKSMFSI